MIHGLEFTIRLLCVVGFYGTIAVFAAWLCWPEKKTP